MARPKDDGEDEVIDLAEVEESEQWINDHQNEFGGLFNDGQG